MTEVGVCQIKKEYILEKVARDVNLSLVSEKDKSEICEKKDEILQEMQDDTPPTKKQKVEIKNKRLKGQNKNRKIYFKESKEQALCSNLMLVSEGEDIPRCGRQNCDYLHDIKKYLELKPKDINSHCYNYKTFGKCNRGLTCRFGSEHISLDGKNRINQELCLVWEGKQPQTKNGLNYELLVSLRKKTYDFRLAETVVKYNDKIAKDQNIIKKDDKSNNTHGAITDEDIIKLQTREKKKIDWKGKLLLSPLTTVGNLPFRRICKKFGADVTCGEMAMCSSLLKGLPQEWALIKRHECEDIFGVQLCTNNPYLLAKCGYFLEREMDVDFIDLNLGCPIELVYRQGAGSGLLLRRKALESCVRSISQILTIPLTIKMRMGVYSNENIAHVLAPKFRDWGASLLTVHGRSREQRYTKIADWPYIQTVAQAATPMPVLANGDILSYEDYEKLKVVAPDITSIMIGRGALIKPWIFTEIKERKLWDISSTERFDILKSYTNYGLEHWGSDNVGVEHTRRFLLEWLSFLHRYVPIGLLERPPQKINERPPYYIGRDELETLMASPSASDWIKISEMLLGKVPENFHFLPKHKANAYG